MINNGGANAENVHTGEISWVRHRTATISKDDV